MQDNEDAVQVSAEFGGLLYGPPRNGERHPVSRVEPAFHAWKVSKEVSTLGTPTTVDRNPEQLRGNATPLPRYCTHMLVHLLSGVSQNWF